MSRKANPKLIGLFVIGAAALLIGLLVALGGGRLFATTKDYVMFFEDDVNGLQVGSAVNFRGVRVGSVQDIVIRYDSDKRQVAIPVYVRLDQDRIRVSGDNGLEDMSRLIELGLRAELRNQSFVTGLMSVELDFDRTAPPRLLGLEPEYTEIPTKRSNLAQLRATFSDFVADIRKLPLDEIMATVSSTAVNLDKLVVDLNRLVVSTNTLVDHTDARLEAALAPVPDTIANIDRAARDARRLIADVNTQMNTQVPQLTDRVVVAIEQMNTTLMQAESAMSSIQTGFGDGSQIAYQAARTLDDVREAANALRGLAEYLQQNPNALLTGKPAQE